MTAKAMVIGVVATLLSAAAIADGKVTKTVAFIGGSITEGSGYRSRVMKLLREKYPDVSFVEIAAGVSSTCSDACAYRLEEEVLAKGAPDLFVVEAAVNDAQDGQFSHTRCVRGMEGAVRHMLMKRPSCAVVVGLMVNLGQYKQLMAGKIPLQYAAHAEVAKHYGVALADVGTALVKESKTGGMTWEEYGDCHPSRVGCDLVAKVLMEAIATVFDPMKPTTVKSLPRPLDPNSYFRGRVVPPEKMTRGAGWQYSQPDWDSIPGGKRKYFTIGPIVWCETPGSVLEFKFSGTSAGAFLTSGPDAGDLEVSVDGGAWKLTKLRAGFGSLHYPYVHQLVEAIADGSHVVRLRVAEAKRKNKDGTLRTCSTIRIHRLYVNGTVE